jgi:microsomal dipeptidase-like Zn-dependent dipeptidase
VQVEHYVKLLAHYSTLFAKGSLPFDLKSPQVHILPAFENASAFASESESLSDALQRLEGYVDAIGPLFYIGMTWDHENRFGGGNLTQVGLKEDGKRLLEWMSGKKIAVDMSHTSDWLAHGILNYIDQNGLDVRVLASHSNFRAISGYPRNLPDDIAKEIVRRKGLIGLNFFAPFIHKTDPSALLRHVEYGLELGAADALSFGADFFWDNDFKYILEKYQCSQAFFPELSDSSVYPYVLGLFAQKLGIKQEQLLKIASQNALTFIK